jgi:hypothetical protein
LTLQSHAQTAKICGHIYDTTDNESLSFAIVILKSSTFDKTIISDVDGNFCFQNLATDIYNLSIKYLGHTKIDTTFRINKDDSLLLNLRMGFSSHKIICYDWIELNADRANHDIAAGHAQLILCGNIVPKQSGQGEFEVKYQVKYLASYEKGTAKGNVEYNQTIFKYLDKTYGNKWRKKVRKDALGL